MEGKYKMLNKEFSLSLASDMETRQALAGELLEKFISDFKATADNEAMRRAFAATLSVPVLQTIPPVSSVRDIFAVDQIPAGALAEYPIDMADIETAVVMPRLGAVPQNLVVGDSLIVPTFEVANSVEWKLSFVRDGRYNIVERALTKLGESFVRAEETAGWATIRGAIDGTNTLNVGAITTIDKATLNSMITEFHAVGYNPEVIYMSPRCAKAIRDWDYTKLDPVTQREIFTGGGLPGGSIWGTEIRELRGLGDKEIYMFDRSRFGVMPIRTSLTTYDKADAINRLRAGVLAWEEIGFAVIDKKAVMKVQLT